MIQPADGLYYFLQIVCDLFASHPLFLTGRKCLAELDLFGNIQATVPLIFRVIILKMPPAVIIPGVIVKSK
jgi:hypothetical protein